MIHVIGKDSITVIFDHPGSALSGVVAELALVVARNRFSEPANRGRRVA